MKRISLSLMFRCLLVAAFSLPVILYTIYSSKDFSNSIGGGHRPLIYVNKNGAGLPWNYRNKKTNIADTAVKSRTGVKGNAMNRPCCVSWGIDRVDCFVRGVDSHVYHWWKENNEVKGWESLLGSTVGEIECVSRHKGSIDILIVGSNNNLWTKRYDGYWADWISRDGNIMDVPSCVVTSNSLVACMTRGATNEAYLFEYSSRAWTYAYCGGLFQYPISMSSRTEGNLDVFGESKNCLHHNRWTLAGGLESWKPLGGGPTHGRPMVVSWNESRMDIFVMGTSSRLMHLAWDDEEWLPWEDLGGELKDVPSCVGFNATIHCFGIGPKSYLYRKSYINRSWTEWISSYGPFQDTPSCIVTNEEEVSCYVEDYNREIVEIVYEV